MCSVTYWGIYAAFIVLALSVSFYSTHSVKYEFDHKSSLGVDFFEGDILWGFKETLVLTLVSTVGGMLASIVGIGGGIIFGPLLLEFGVHPKVASSTSMFLVMYTTLSNTIQFII